MKPISKKKVGHLVLEKPWPRLHLLSDLHLDTGPYELPAGVDFDILVAAGDIGPVETAVPWLAALGKPIVYVLGNYERYHADLDEVVVQAKRLAQGTQVHVLERDAVVIDGMRFLGTTLWTNFGELTRQLVAWSLGGSSDFRRIKAARYAHGPVRNRVERLCRRIQRDVPEPGDFHPVIAYIEHKASMQWLQEQLVKPFDGPTVVVTHHAPTFESLRAFGIRDVLLDRENWDYHDEDLMRVGNYASNLTPFLKSHYANIELWCHGHLHKGIDVLDSGVRIMCNPRGYHQKPLTEEAAKAFSLWSGFGISAPTIARSQASFEKEPFRGDAPEFNPRLVVDLTDGPAQPLSKYIRAPVAEMHRLHNEAARIAAFLTPDDTVLAECVRTVFGHTCGGFANVVKAMLVKHATQLDAYAAEDSNLFGGLPHPAPIPCVPWVFPGWIPDINRDYLAQLQWMEVWIRWTKVLPFAAKTRLLQWQLIVNQALAALGAIGLVAMALPLGRLGLRRVDTRGSGIAIYVEKDVDIARAGAQLERALNQNKIPRRHDISVRSVEGLPEGEAATLRRMRALQAAILLPGIPAPVDLDDAASAVSDSSIATKGVRVDAKSPAASTDVAGQLNPLGVPPDDGEMLSTRQVAQLLHVSLPYVIKLLDHGYIPGIQKTDSGHRRIPRAAALEYKAQRKVNQAKASANVARVSRDLGLYDDELEGIPKAPKSR